MFNIYNKSSEKMSEVQDKSVDLIMTSPPYNIGTQYGENKDRLDVSTYQTLLQNVFSECSRVLKDDGKLIVEAADSVVTDNVYMQLIGYIQSLCINYGFKIEERHINFALTKNGVELPEHNWNEDYTTKIDAHSNIHQIIVLSKVPNATFKNTGKIMYFNYESTPEHPCPTPHGIYEFVLDTYFKRGMTVLDAFMGTARLGVAVLKREGNFIGYELDKDIFEVAQKNLSDN